MATVIRTQTDNPKFKEMFTLLLLILTIIWGLFAAILTFLAYTKLDGASILAAAGADTLFGSLIAWDTMTIQYWFRKKPGDTDSASIPAEGSISAVSKDGDIAKIL